MKQLLEFYDGEQERVGFVLPSGEIVEVDNIHPEPSKSFRVSGTDLLEYKDAVASWHTHPGATGNLSVGDYDTFLNWPQLRHYIVGNNGVWEFYVEDGDVYCA